MAWASARVLELDANVGLVVVPARTRRGRAVHRSRRDDGATDRCLLGFGRDERRAYKKKQTSVLFVRRRSMDALRARGPAAAATRAPPQKLSIAPMMEYTTPHFRHLVRLLTANTWLYTEMEVDQALRHTDHPRLDRFLGFPRHAGLLPQLGGSDPGLLARSRAASPRHARDELNLNCGCPSPKVAGKGNFGASLMLDPSLVADCVAAMAENSGGRACDGEVPRGDDVDSYDALCAFVERVSANMPPCPSANDKPLFAIHARKALLNGLSPAENRAVPPLRRRVGLRFSARLSRRRLRAQRGDSRRGNRGRDREQR